MELGEFRECMGDATLVIFMSLEGITISSQDPLIGEENCSIVLKSEADFQQKREYPMAGDRLENYHIDKKTGAWHTTPSHWVVWRVEAFNSIDETQAMREVVIAWCEKRPL